MSWYLFFAIFSLSIFAEECSPVDLRESHRLTTQVRNQGNISWCYAHTAADLVQYHYNSLPLSAADIAINYSSVLAAKFIHHLMNIVTYRGQRPTVFMEPQTGFIKYALEQSFEQGFCPRNILPDQTIRKITFESGTYSEVDYGRAMFDILKNIQPAVKRRDTKFDYMYEFPGLPLNNLVTILDRSERQKVFDNVANQICKTHRLHFEKPQIIQKIRGTQLFTSINQQLDKNNIVGIDYNSALLHDRSKASSSLGSLHTSTIIGKRWNERLLSCEYLVRNSYGPECQNYDPTYSCEQGNIWIPRQFLEKSIFLITYLKK